MPQIDDRNEIVSFDSITIFAEAGRHQDQEPAMTISVSPAPPKRSHQYIAHLKKGQASTEQSFLLQRVQPATAGLMDGSLSTLAPIFTVALATHQPRYAFFAGLASAIGAGVSMAFSEGLSDTGEMTGRGSPYLRGLIIGGGTFVGGVLHTLPFLIPNLQVALVVAIVMVGLELLALSWIRWRFFTTGFVRSFVSISLGGLIIVGISAAIGSAG
jgi:hypothetical protein